MPLTINILNAKEKVAKLHNQFLASKTLIEIIAYIVKAESMKKLAYLTLFQKNSKLLKGF